MGPPACFAINLAAPEAWEHANSLGGRKPEMHRPTVAYVLPPGTSAGSWFGAVEFVRLGTGRGGIADAVTRIRPGCGCAVFLG
jgi:hypothetical protein